jgi:hypothetical protein
LSFYLSVCLFVDETWRRNMNGILMCFNFNSWPSYKLNENETFLSFSLSQKISFAISIFSFLSSFYISFSQWNTVLETRFTPLTHQTILGKTVATLHLTPYFFVPTIFHKFFPSAILHSNYYKNCLAHFHCAIAVISNFSNFLFIILVCSFCPKFCARAVFSTFFIFSVQHFVRSIIPKFCQAHFNCCYSLNFGPEPFSHL